MKVNFNSMSEENSNQNDYITISKKEYDYLLDCGKKLLALEAAGVDNWESYDDAMIAYYSGDIL